MNKWLLVLNLVLLLAVAFLFYSHFNKPSDKPASGAVSASQEQNNSQFRIAYFEMDSVEEYFSLFKEVQKELVRKQDSKNSALSSLHKKHRAKWESLQKNGRNMTEQEITESSQDIAEIENAIKNTERKWDQEINDYFVTQQQNILKMIRDFFAEYNKDKGYAYILANEPGLFYYKDSACNVTADLIKALNEKYKPGKK